MVFGIHIYVYRLQLENQSDQTNVILQIIFCINYCDCCYNQTFFYSVSLTSEEQIIIIGNYINYTDKIENNLIRQLRMQKQRFYLT